MNLKPTLVGLVTFVLLNLAYTPFVCAQRTCASDSYLLQRLKNDVKFAERFSKSQNATIPSHLKSALVCNNSNSIVIPVAVHYSTPITCANLDCLLDAAEAQIDVLNEDFSADNDDLTNYTVDLNGVCNTAYPLSRAPEEGDGTCIKFCLASLNHPASSGLSDGEPAITIDQHVWPSATSIWSGYLNIFVSNAETANQGASTLGISALPGAADGDGFWINYKNFGGPGFTCTSGATLNSSASFNNGRTATHEAGHYFGLYHVFQGSNCSDNDSNPPGPIDVNDTPAQDSPHYGCPSVNSCSDAPKSCSTGYDNFYSFMDYSNDDCMVMFTADQCDVLNWWANDLVFVDDAIACSGDGVGDDVNCYSPTCSDGIQNGSETGIDCGGVDCDACDFACGDTFLDSGGTEEYFNNEDLSWTICASGSEIVQLVFTSFAIEQGGGSGCYDELEVFDGATTNTPSFGTFCGYTIAESPGGGIIESTGNCITLKFTSDNSVTKEGWVADIICGSTSTCDDGIQNGSETGVDCGGTCDVCPQNCDEMFLDSGGSSSNYGSNEGTEFLVCPDDPDTDKIELNFTYVDIEAASGNGNNGTGCWDILKIYDGENDSAPMIGNYCGEEGGDGDMSNVAANNLTAGMVFESTDPSGCLYFMFESDASNNESGWEAEINCSALNAVPVEWLAFDVSSGNNGIVLSWSTTSEINNKGFFVQRSIDGILFEDIGFVNSAESIQLINEYSYVDRTDLQNIIYYRLQQIDYDGTSDYSVIKSVQINEKTRTPLFYPNPTATSIYIDYKAQNGENMEQILVYNKTGQIVKSLDYKDISSSNMELDLESLSQGIYILVLKTSLNTHIQQITKI